MRVKVFVLPTERGRQYSRFCDTSNEKRPSAGGPFPCRGVAKIKTLSATLQESEKKGCFPCNVEIEFYTFATPLKRYRAFSHYLAAGSRQIPPDPARSGGRPGPRGPPNTRAAGQDDVSYTNSLKLYSGAQVDQLSKGRKPPNNWSSQQGARPTGQHRQASVGNK